MANTYFEFKQFRVQQQNSAMKVNTDSVLLGAWVNCGNANRILDIGTGTGLLALMLAQKSDARIDAVEIDADSCIDASTNFTESTWKDKITLIEGDIVKSRHLLACNYDIIISNPPYFENSLKSPSLSRSNARHTDSLSFDLLLSITSDVLSSEGYFYTILPSHVVSRFSSIANHHNLFCHELVRIYPIQGKEHNRTMIKYGKTQQVPSEESLIIRNENQTFTSEYMRFTEDFYLAF